MCHVPGPRGISPGYFVAPAGHRLNVFPGASRSQHRLPSFLLMKYGSRGCNAVGCANTNDHKPTNTRSSFSAPKAVLDVVEQGSGCVQAQTHMFPKAHSSVRLSIRAVSLNIWAVSKLFAQFRPSIIQSTNGKQHENSRLHTTAHGAVDEDWRLEKTGARPVLDRRRLEKTPNAPFANDSDTLGLRSAVQNKASAHLLALPAITSYCSYF